MAYKGTAGKSASGASMSKYDVEVEARLQALEKGLAECKAACDARAGGGGGDSSKLDTLIDCLNQFPAAASYFPKNENGERKL
tara:strand:+ start:331 stop:579 length:249 start_codon:yes stop_codon:yes gene_type:complete